ncbi:MAG: RNA polymerase sigma factor [Marinilabiliaceae bacterium]|nr:RNA polymerase sigma factor [Marinilabiliaceae bacterium]
MNSFECIYKENYPKMYRLAKKMVYDQDVVADIVQEIFLYYYEKMQNEILVLNLKNWLLRAVVNKCTDYLNRKKKHTELTAIQELATEDNSFEKQNSNLTLRQAIKKLKPLEMKLVILYSEDYSYKEIAQIADIKFSSVGKTLSRALLKLKEILIKMKYEMY